MQDSDSKIFLVTGATGAIGKAIARQLAAAPHSEVVLLCRGRHKAELAVQDIIDSTGNPKVNFQLADLGRQHQIRELAKRWTGPLHVLINNAACTPRSRQETPEGIEMQFATNVLGYFWLIDAFTDILKASAPARVVNVASYWAGGLDLDDLEFTRLGKKPFSRIVGDARMLLPQPEFAIMAPTSQHMAAAMPHPFIPRILVHPVPGSGLISDARR